MPIGFYSGGLMGLQRQVLLNVINVGHKHITGCRGRPNFVVDFSHNSSLLLLAICYEHNTHLSSITLSMAQTAIW